MALLFHTLQFFELFRIYGRGQKFQGLELVKIIGATFFLQVQVVAYIKTKLQLLNIATRGCCQFGRVHFDFVAFFRVIVFFFSLEMEVFFRKVFYLLSSLTGMLFKLEEGGALLS